MTDDELIELVRRCHRIVSQRGSARIQVHGHVFVTSAYEGPVGVFLDTRIGRMTVNWYGDPYNLCLFSVDAPLEDQSAQQILSSLRMGASEDLFPGIRAMVLNRLRRSMLLDDLADV